MKKIKICQKIVKNCKKSSKLSIFDEKFCSKNTAWLSQGARGVLEGARGCSRVLAGARGCSRVLEVVL